MEHEHAASLTARAVKKVLPERAILTRDARQTLSSAASMFTLYLASVAHDASSANKRQTITLKDVLQALRDVDFEHFIEPVEECLEEMRSVAARKKTQKHVANGEVATTSEVTEQFDDVTIDTNEEDADDDGMQSVEGPSEMEEDDDEEFVAHEEPTVDDTMHEEDSQPKGGETNAERTDDEQIARKETTEGEQMGGDANERSRADTEDVGEGKAGDSADAMEVTPS